MILPEKIGYWIRRGFQRLKRREGQTAVEYVMVAGMLLAVVGVLAVFLYALRQHSNRVMDLVASDYP